MVFTGKTTSSHFAISRQKVDWGFPLSLLIFTLPLEPLAQAIHSSSTISPNSSNNAHNHILFFEDDILLYLSNTVQCNPHVLSSFEHYGILSGFKMNCQKSELMPLNQAIVSAPLHSSFPVTKTYVVWTSVLPYRKAIAYLDRCSRLAALCRIVRNKPNILSRVNVVTFSTSSVLEQFTISSNKIYLAW